MQAALYRLNAGTPLLETAVKPDVEDDEVVTSPAERIAKLRRAAAEAAKLAESASKLSSILEKDVFPVLDVIIPLLQKDEIPASQFLLDLRAYLSQKGYK